jgi:SAM-dependent methyltransferase
LLRKDRRGVEGDGGCGVAGGPAASPTLRPVPREPAYLAPYANAVKVHGGRFEAMLWRSEAMQRRRFEVLVEISGLAARARAGPIRLVDAGCGRGDLATHLAAAGIGIGEGIGIEAMEPLRRAASRRGHAGWRFVGGDFLADRMGLQQLEPDLVFFSGSLNTFPRASLERAVARAFEAARVGVAFNFLSSHGARRGVSDRPARRFDPVRMLAWAMGLTPSVALRQDYLGPHDATVWMAKVPSAPTPSG